MKFLNQNDTKFEIENLTVYNDMEEVFHAFGSTWFWDGFFLFFTTPISLFGFVTNLISVQLFFKSIFNLYLY